MSDLTAKDIREAGSSKSILANVFRYQVSKSTPVADMLAMLPDLTAKLVECGQQIDREFVTLRMEEDIAHMHDNEEVAMFADRFRNAKASLNSLKESVEVEEFSFSEAIEKFDQNKSLRTEASFIKKATDLFISIKSGSFRDAKEVYEKSIEEILADLEKVEFIKEVIKKMPDSDPELLAVNFRLSQMAKDLRDETTVRLNKYLEAKGVTVEKEESYKNIGLIYKFFCSIKDKKLVQETVFKSFAGPRKNHPITSKEEIKDYFVKGLMILKNHIKNMSIRRGIFPKIFSERADEEFDNFCSYMGNHHVGEMASDILKDCLSQSKYAYFLNFFDLFNTSFDLFKSSVVRISNSTTYRQTVETCFVKYMAVYGRDYFKLEKDHFLDFMNLYYRLLDRSIEELKKKLDLIDTATFVSGLKSMISREKMGEIMSFYRTTLQRVQRNIPAYMINEKCNEIIDIFFEQIFKYFKAAIELIRARVLSNTDTAYTDFKLYSLLGLTSQDLELIGASKVDVCELFNKLFDIKNLEKKYKVFDEEIKNDLNNCISLLLERLFTDFEEAPEVKIKMKKEEAGLRQSVHCKNVLEKLNGLHSELFRSFTETARKKIYYNIGNRLINHLKKYIPSKAYIQNYSSSLQIDMHKFEDFIKALESTTLVESFAMLARLVRIISLPADQIQTYIDTSKLNQSEWRHIVDRFVDANKSMAVSNK